MNNKVELLKSDLEYLRNNMSLFIDKYDYICYFDGSIAPINPCGEMGFSCVVTDIQGNIDFEYSCAIPPCVTNTVNVAEHCGLNALLNYLHTEFNGDAKFLVLGDSGFVINQMNKVWKINSGKPYSEIATLNFELIDFLNITFKWIKRDFNTYADYLSTKTMKRDKDEFAKELYNKHLLANLKKANKPSCSSESEIEIESEYLIPFGMFEGRYLHQARVDYLKWVASDKFAPTNELGATFKKEVIDFFKKNV